VVPLRQAIGEVLRDIRQRQGRTRQRHRPGQRHAQRQRSRSQRCTQQAAYLDHGMNTHQTLSHRVRNQSSIVTDDRCPDM